MQERSDSAYDAPVTRVTTAQNETQSIQRSDGDAFAPTSRRHGPARFDHAIANAMDHVIEMHHDAHVIGYDADAFADLGPPV